MFRVILFPRITSKLKKKFQREYRDCGMETRPGCRVHATIVTSCHRNDNEAWSTSCLIMQHKSYIVEQPPTYPFKSYYHYTSECNLV